MNKIIAFAAAVAAAGCAAAGPVETSADDESKLAAELAGYEQTGPEVSCISMRNVRGNRSVGQAVLFTGNGGRLWVNRPAGGCPDVRSDLALRTQTTTSQLCRGDIAHIFDPVNGIDYGACGLGNFTPYRRTRADG
jgi:hypothetical protein